ncbi:hypothetical protein BG015_005619, partial [Linnemannia schmuckeri]
MSDIVSPESSLFWKLTIPPTQFDGFFCESVTRHFESEPEPCSQLSHIWKCAFTENMINGVATIDIVIQRAEIKKKGGSPFSLSPPSSFPSGGHQQQQHHQQQEQQERSSSSQSQSQTQTQTQTQTQMQDQQVHNQRQGQQGQGQQLPPTKYDMPARIHYKTIALHTPKTLAPLMSMFLDGVSTGDTPIRVELEANAILHRGKYAFEIVLSEEISSYMNPSPSSCHRVFDSLYHEIVATSHPDTSTADIWFEFYPHSTTASEAAAANTSIQDRRSLPSMLLPVGQHHLHHEQVHFDGGSAVAVVGAHFEKLVKYPYFADWIEREKRAQEEERRRQLEEERRIHQEHHERRRQHQQQTRLFNPQWHLEPPYRPSESQVGEFEDQQRLTWVEQPPTPRLSRYGDQQHHLHYQPLQRAEYHPHETPTHFQPLQGPSSSSSTSISFPSHQQHARPPSPQHQHQQHHHSRPDPSSRPQQADQPGPPPPPALRIPVRDVSLGTFQVILQYIYTDAIGLSDGQIKDIDKYWNDNPEDHLASQQNRNPLEDENMPSMSSLLAYYHARDRPSDSERCGSGNVSPRPPVILPVPEPLIEALGDQQQQQPREEEEEDEGEVSGIQGPTAPLDRPRTNINEIMMANNIYTFTTASAQTAWIPCSPRDRRKEFRDPGSPPSSCVFREQPIGEYGEQSADCSSDRQGQGQGQGGGAEGEQSSSGNSGGLHTAGGSSAFSSSSTTNVHPPTHQLHVHKTRPTCSWESLLLAANLFQLQDLETTAIKAIRYHCQMLASRALINNNAIAEVAHNGFDRSNLDLQLVLGERILLSLLKLYNSPLLRIHPEGVKVLRGGASRSGGGGRGGGEGKRKSTEGGEEGGGSQHREHASAGPPGLQTQLKEQCRCQAEEQQGGVGERQEEETEKGKKSDNNDDGRKQEEGHLGTVQTASSSSSSSSSRTRGGGNSGAASSRARGSRRPSGQRRSSDTAQPQVTIQEHDPESSSSTRTWTQTTSSGSSSSARPTGHHQRQGYQGHGDDGGGEGQHQPSGESGSTGREENEEGEAGEEGDVRGREGGSSGPERITTPLTLLDHPECEPALQELCEELRERFLSMREIMESPHCDPR